MFVVLFTLCLITFLLGVTVFDSFDTFLILTMVILFYIATSVHLRNSWNYSYPCSYVVDILFIGKKQLFNPKYLILYCIKYIKQPW